MLGLLLLAVPSPASADLGDVSVVAGVSYDQAYRLDSSPQHGYGSLAGVRVGVADDWRVFANATYAAFLGPGETADLLSVVAGASYLVDVATWVPELFLGIGYFGPAGRAGFSHDVGLVAGGGIEYRRFREFGVGLRVEYRLPFRSLHEYAGALSVAPYVAFHF
jgi:hypothetical protein